MSIVNITKNVSINALRFTLALVFAFSGFVKAVDPMGTVYKMADYAEAFSLSLPAGLLFVGAILLITIEYVIGICLFFGLYRKFYLSLTVAFLLVMTPLTLYLALYNPVTDCGCFGDAVVLTNWQTFGKNLLLLLMAVVALLGSKHVWIFMSDRTRWLIFVYAIVSVSLFIPYNLRHLPAIDFRPYHIGANIIDGMTVPDDAPQDEYETLFVLEKEGQQRTFTADNYPDSTWTFVSRENRLVSRGYVPPITDFHLATLDGDDVTWEVLEQPGYTFLVVAHDLERTNEGMLDVLNDLYDYAIVNGYAFYMLTSSSEQATREWSEHTAAAYPYLQADEILLKTMIRSNPGLIVLKDATVIGKWSAADMPRDEQLVTPIEAKEVEQLATHKQRHRYVAVALWMFFPLFLLVALDKIYCKKDKFDNTSINNLKT
ncbi:MAG: DoxX family protein [Bacteroidaceae bacterium]|nr:DoxX family protein [Bacteroidaceae bacterium]